MIKDGQNPFSFYDVFLKSTAFPFCCLANLNELHLGGPSGILMPPVHWFIHPHAASTLVHNDILMPPVHWFIMTSSCRQYTGSYILMPPVHWFIHPHAASTLVHNEILMPPVHWFIMTSSCRQYTGSYILMPPVHWFIICCAY